MAHLDAGAVYLPSVYTPRAACRGRCVVQITGVAELTWINQRRVAWWMGLASAAAPL